MGIAAAVVLILGTVAFGVAATTQRPPVRAIPTVVTDKAVSRTGAATATVSPTDAREQSTAAATTGKKASSSSKKATAARATGSSAGSAPSSAKSKKSSSAKSGPSAASQREVVTPKVREESDSEGSGSSNPGSGSSSMDPSTQYTVSPAIAHRDTTGR